MINPSDISSRHLKIFLTVFEEKSLGRAAKKLFLSQPAISQAIALLESQMGIVLFERSRKGVLPTREAEILRDGVIRSGIALANAITQIEELSNLQRGSLNIAASDTLSMYVLPSMLSRFRKACPGIDLKLQNRSSDEIIEMVKNHEVEAGFISLSGKDDRLSVMGIGKSKIKLVTPESLKGISSGDSLKEIARLDLILLERKSRFRRLLENIFLSRRIEMNVVMEVSSFEVAKKLVSEGLGSSLIPSIALDISKKSNFRIYDTPSALPDISYGLVTLEEIHYPALRKFIDFASETGF
jgi:DNA-binding transcriptional LysR family regulator